MIFYDKKLIKVPNSFLPPKELKSDNPKSLIVVKITAFQSNNKTKHKDTNFNTTNSRNGKNKPEK